MGHHCCVPNCNSNSRVPANSRVTFHAFPADPKERKQWILKVKRADCKTLTVNRHTKVCSKHFRDEDFIQPQVARRRMLKKGVVPSVFSYGKSDQEESEVEKKNESSSDESGGDFLKTQSKPQSSKASRPTSNTDKKDEVKNSDKNNDKMDTESSESKNSTERKTREKNVVKDIDTLSRTIMPNPSCSSPTKSDDSEHGSDVTATNGSSPNSNNDTSNRKVGPLNFQIGTRLEAKDLGNEMWYPVKVVEVDWDDEEVLIHFEKWSQRYDEWVPMDSSRLRPTQNPSPQNDGKNASKVFNVGDRVMAKWSDCRRYPAKVKAVLGDDRYEVLFFDGFTKNIKGIRMSKLEGDMDSVSEIGPGSVEEQIDPPIIEAVVKNEVISEAIGTKEERRERKRKLNVMELFHPKKRMRLDAEALSPKSPLETDKGRKVEKGKTKKENVSEVEDNEGERSSIAPDSNGVVDESVNGSEIDEKVEGKKVEEEEETFETVGKSKKKSSSRAGGGGVENADKPRRGGLRHGEVHGKTKYLEGKSHTRKIPRNNFSVDQESPKSRRDSSAEEGETASRKKKKELSDDSSKPAQKSESNKETDKSEPESWKQDGQSYVVDSIDGPRKTTVVPDKNLPSGWSKHTLQRKHGNSAGKWDVFLVSPQGRRFRSRNELRLYFEEKGEPFRTDKFDFCLSGKKRRSRTSDDTTTFGRRMSRGGSDKAKAVSTPGESDAEQQSVPPPQQSAQPQRRVKTLLPKVRRTSTSQSEDDVGEKLAEPSSPPPPYTTTVASIPAVKIQTEMQEGEVLVGGLKIQMENNTFKCPKEGCGKNFRKENLLQMHIKHYHPEYNKFMGSTPNVADLAYARTIGESIDDLMPKSRYSSIGTIGVGGTYLEKLNRFETSRKNKTNVSTGATGAKGGVGGSGGAGDGISPMEKKKITKEKLQSALAAKKAGKGMVGDAEGRVPSDDAVIEIKESGDERSPSIDSRENPSTPTADIMVSAGHKEEKKEPQTTIKTLLPVIRSPSHGQETSSAERLKNKFPTVDESEEYVDVIDVGSKHIPLAHSTNSQLEPQVAPASTLDTVSITKSLRKIRRRRQSDFHFEPLYKRRKIASKLEMSEDVDVVDISTPLDADTSPAIETDGTAANGKSTPTYRYSRKKTPVVHLEKLNVTTDSNGRVVLSPSVKNPAESKLIETPAESSAVEQLRKEELINCTCGFMEEDGLMIQCDLCLCWQHGLCNNIEKESDVPEKYVCPICINPYRQRKSKKYIHDQDWLKEGKLPSLSFRSKNESNIQEREAISKRSHDLSGSLLQIQQVLHSLRVKVNIAEKPDHPKLYLWARNWEKDGENSSGQTSIGSESEFKSQLDHVESCSDTDAKIDSMTNSVAGTNITFQKNISDKEGSIVKSENETNKSDSRTDLDKSENIEEDQKEVVTIETEIGAEVALSGNVMNEESSVECKDLKEECKSEINEVSNEETCIENVVYAPDIESSAVNEDNEKETSLTRKEYDESMDSNTDSPETSPKKKTETKSNEIKEDIKESLPKLPTEKRLKEEKFYDKNSIKQEDKSLGKRTNVDKDNVESELEVPDSKTALDSAKEQTDPKPVEGVIKPNAEQKSDSEEKPVSTDENHGLLHQALTNGSQITNSLNNGSIGNQLDTSADHPMLQLPICQSELMQFANSMADNLRMTEPAHSAAPEPGTITVPQPPKAPQPEAPIDPVECRLSLLDHIEHFQTQIDTRLTMLEEQVAALEAQDPDAAKDEGPEFYPQTKQTIQMLLRDLFTIRRIAALN